MKALKMVLIACSLSAAAVVAHAQTSDPAAGAQQLAQNQAQSRSNCMRDARLAPPSKAASLCRRKRLKSASGR